MPVIVRGDVGNLKRIPNGLKGKYIQAHDGSKHNITIVNVGRRTRDWKKAPITPVTIGKGEFLGFRTRGRGPFIGYNKKDGNFTGGDITPEGLIYVGGRGRSNTLNILQFNEPGTYSISVGDRRQSKGYKEGPLENRTIKVKVK